MRKIATILVLIIFCNSFFYYTYFYFSLVRAKIEAAGSISNWNIAKTSVRVPAEELQKDESDEVWYNNKLFDVAKRESVNDTAYVYIIRDEEEQDVLTKNGDYFKNDSGIALESGYRSSPLKKVAGITDNYYVSAGTKNFLFLSYLFRPPTVKNKYCIISICTDVPTPPPKKAQAI